MKIESVNVRGGNDKKMFHKKNDKMFYLQKAKGNSQIKSTFFHKKILTPLMTIVLAFLCIAGTTGVSMLRNVTYRKQTNEALYAAATKDAMTIEPDELFSLVCLTPEDKQTIWQDGKVLLATLHNESQAYTTGEKTSILGEVWMVSANELANWCGNNKRGITNWELRLQQLLGVPLSSRYTRITTMWVSPEDIIRPAYSMDITSADMITALPEDTPNEYREWFEANVIWSYFNSEYPWTRLGYTYDWAEDSDEYGLTEFLLKEGTEVIVADTNMIDEYIKHLDQE